MCSEITSEKHNVKNQSIPILVIRLKWREPWNAAPAPHLLRGAIATAFADNDLFHQHRNDGSSIYRYPRIHYRWEGDDGLVIGFGEGIKPLGDLFTSDLELDLGKRRVVVSEAELSYRTDAIEVLPRLRRYRFRSPWLPLNQDNFSAFQEMSRSEQSVELDRIAVGNILSALKGFGIHIEDRVYAAVIPRRRHACHYKDQKLMGFLGTFLTNIALPDDFAVGRAVSHGYGWIRRDYNLC